MAFVQKNWAKRITEYPNRRKLTNVSDASETVVDIERYEGVISQAGDGFTQTNMNDLEQRIADAFDDEHEYLTAILAANETTVSFTDDSIVAGCRVHVFVPMDKCKLVYDAISIPSEGHLNITFPAQETDTVIQVTIDNPLT